MKHDCKHGRFLNTNWLGVFLPSTVGNHVKKIKELQPSEVLTLQRDVALRGMAWVLPVLHIDNVTRPT